MKGLSLYLALVYHIIKVIYANMHSKLLICLISKYLAMIKRDFLQLINLKDAREKLDYQYRAIHYRTIETHSEIFNII
jgi:hypothetical protein